LIRAFIFDFDGTLVESNDVKQSAFFAVTADITGAAAILERILAAPDIGDRYDIFAKLVSEIGGDQRDAGRLVDAYGAFCERQILDMLKSSRIMPLLDGLKAKGYALFIASATPEINLISMLAKSPFARVFEAVCGRPRSKAAILRDICQTHGWSPHEVIMVGDGELDSQGAVEFGCRFIGVDVEALARPAFFDHMLDVAGDSRDR
jgi:phosphoglycolate phosphatase-like HAD superfamily hydrolase